MTFLLFAFSIISLVIAVFQFVKGKTLETILSIIYSSLFFISGMMNKPKRVERNKKNGKINFYNYPLFCSLFTLSFIQS